MSHAFFLLADDDDDCRGHPGSNDGAPLSHSPPTLSNDDDDDDDRRCPLLPQEMMPSTVGQPRAAPTADDELQAAMSRRPGPLRAAIGGCSLWSFIDSAPQLASRRAELGSRRFIPFPCFAANCLSVVRTTLLLYSCARCTGAAVFGWRPSLPVLQQLFLSRWMAGWLDGDPSGKPRPWGDPRCVHGV
jgi:hypothetical protein